MSIILFRNLFVTLRVTRSLLKYFRTWHFWPCTTICTFCPLPAVQRLAYWKDGGASSPRSLHYEWIRSFKHRKATITWLRKHVTRPIYWPINASCLGFRSTAIQFKPKTIIWLEPAKVVEDESSSSCSTPPGNARSKLPGFSVEDLISMDFTRRIKIVSGVRLKSVIMHQK